MNTVITAFLYIVEFFIAINCFGDIMNERIRKTYTVLIGIVLYAFAFSVHFINEHPILNVAIFFSVADNEDVNEYIDKIYGEIAHHSMFGNTKNKMLDLMINKYQYICEAERIEFYVSIKTANLLFIESPDLISMLGNLLDNAVEAAKNSAERKIDLSINRVNGFDILTCTNSCDTSPQATGKILKTTKNDDGVHGLGVRSIKSVVKKYKGDFEWSYNENAKEFAVYIAFSEKLN